MTAAPIDLYFPILQKGTFHQVNITARVFIHPHEQITALAVEPLPTLTPYPLARLNHDQYTNSQLIVPWTPTGYRNRLKYFVLVFICRPWPTRRTPLAKP